MNIPTSVNHVLRHRLRRTAIRRAMLPEKRTAGTGRRRKRNKPWTREQFLTRKAFSKIMSSGGTSINRVAAATGRKNRNGAIDPFDSGPRQDPLREEYEARHKNPANGSRISLDLERNGQSDQAEKNVRNEK